MERYATALAESIERALPAWVQRCVSGLMTAWTGGTTPDVAAAAAQAGERAARDVGPRIRALLAADIDDQRTTPLAILRSVAVRYPTEVLEQAGVPPVERDAYAERVFPDDPYDLGPATLADLDPGLLDAGIVWGAAKAYEHKRRHGATS